MPTQNMDQTDNFLGDDLATRWLAMVDRDKPFSPVAYYDRDGDCIEFLASDDSFRAERVDDRLTVYYSRETGEVIGSLLFAD